MVQGGENRGQQEQHPRPVDEWADEPFVPAGGPGEAPSSPAPASVAAQHQGRAPGGSPRWIRRAAGGLAAVLLLGAGVYYGIDRWLGGDGRRFNVPAGCAGQVQLRLAVAPEVVPLVERASAEVDNLCPTLAITPLEAGQTAAILATGDFDGMVPASSAWLRLAPVPSAKPVPSGNPVPSGKPVPSTEPVPSGKPVPTTEPVPSGKPVPSTEHVPSGKPVPSTKPESAAPAGSAPQAAPPPTGIVSSLVRTPIVVALPQPAAGALGWPQRQPGWAELAAATVGGRLRFSMANPTGGATGLLAVLGVHAAMGRTTPDQGIAQMRALTLRSRLADASADPAALLQRLESMSDPVAAVKEIGAFPVTEQALWAHQAKKPAIPLAAIYPGDGLMEADYPLALAPAAAADGRLKEIATRLAEHFRSPSFAATIREQGFRPAADAKPAALTSAAPADGLPAAYPAAAATPSDPAVVTSRAAQWARYERLNFQVLILLDASASMNDQVRDRSGKLTTKAALLRTAGVQAAQLFGLDTSVGVWLFATPGPNTPPYVEVISLGPLDEPLGGVARREAVRRMAENYSAYDKAGTPLYETVLRGVNAMRQRAKPGTVNMVVALTDGRDEQTSFSMPRSEFLSRLGAARDPQRPVPVFCIGYGADADMEALNDISRATGGRAAASNDPGDLASAMAQVFLAAHVAQ